MNPTEEPLHYGDIVCYTGLSTPHDEPLMFVGQCGHSPRKGGGPGLIDILDITGKYQVAMSHKAVEMWRRCTHV